MGYNCLYLLKFVILFFLTFGTIKSVQYINNNFIDCKVTKILNRHCYEYNGAIWLEQYVQINENELAFTICGKVLNCETSPCIVDIKLNNTYSCFLYKDTLYNLPYVQNNMRLIFTITTLLISIFLISFTLHLILYCDSNIVNSDLSSISFSKDELLEIKSK